MAFQQLIFSSISDTIFLTDNNGIFTFISPNFETNITYFSQTKQRYEVSDLLGRDFFEHFLINFLNENFLILNLFFIIFN